MPTAIGIDLGTSRSMAAVVEGGRPRLLTEPVRGVPSVVAIDDAGQTLVGEQALAQEALDPTSAVRASKRLLGRSVHGPSADLFTYEVLSGPDASLLVRLKEKVLTLEEVSSSILAHVSQVAAHALGRSFEGVVVTVPAYFNERQRQAVRSAGTLAGLDVLGLLNEPTAAALAHGLGRNLEQRVLVFDLGGGTFDLSVIDIHGSVYEVVATGGDTALGGVDFDDRVLEHLLDHLKEKEGLDLEHDLDALRALRSLSEQAKIQLSETEEARISLAPLAEHELVLTRGELEEMVEDLVERTLEVTDHVLREAGVDASQFDELLLVGGQSRMPRIRERVKEMLGMPVSTRADPDGAVATGAAVLAWSLAGQQPDTADLTEILPLAVGVALPDGRMHNLFPRGATLPQEEQVTLTTHADAQRSIRLSLYQGQGEHALDNALLGHFTFGGLREAGAGGVCLDVSIRIDASGLLTLQATDKETGEVARCEIRMEDAAPEVPKEKPQEVPEEEPIELAGGEVPVPTGPEYSAPEPRRPEVLDQEMEPPVAQSTLPPMDLDPEDAPDPPGLEVSLPGPDSDAPPGLEDLEPPPPPPVEGQHQVLPGNAQPYSMVQGFFDRILQWLRTLFRV